MLQFCYKKRLVETSSLNISPMTSPPDSLLRILPWSDYACCWTSMNRPITEAVPDTLHGLSHPHHILQDSYFPYFSDRCFYFFQLEKLYTWSRTYHLLCLVIYFRIGIFQKFQALSLNSGTLACFHPLTLMWPKLPLCYCSYIIFS